MRFYGKIQEVDLDKKSIQFQLFNQENRKPYRYEKDIEKDIKYYFCQNIVCYITFDDFDVINKVSNIKD